MVPDKPRRTGLRAIAHDLRELYYHNAWEGKGWTKRNGEELRRLVEALEQIIGTDEEDR